MDYSLVLHKRRCEISWQEEWEEEWMQEGWNPPQGESNHTGEDTRFSQCLDSHAYGEQPHHLPVSTGHHLYL